MWELISANKRKSWIIFLAMGITLVLMGYFIGSYWFGPQAGYGGVLIALFLWVLLSLVSYHSGDSIILAMSRAKKVERNIHPQLFNIVEEMKIAANLPQMPQVYIIDEPAPNAFATGISPQKSAVAVTAGLLTRLNRDELQGVIAHEMSHIVNRDVLYVTFAGVMLGSMVMLSNIFLRSLWYSGSSSRRYRSGSSSGGQAQILIFVVAIIAALLAPLLARLFYFALSRKREYLADASAVRLTRYPEGLASALEKISRQTQKLEAANPVTAPMYIINPLNVDLRGAQGLFSTHPPAEERIKILRSMTQGANYANYQKAYSQVKGSGIMPASGLRDSENVALRSALTEKEQERSSKTAHRDLGDLMRAVNNYVFLSCSCGLKIKVPPDFNQHTLNCPRCRRQIVI